MVKSEHAKDPGMSESLGRGVFSRRNASRARRSSRIPKRVFLERKGVTEISVDRLDLMPEVKAVEMARAVADNRDANFYGWAVLITERACRSSRRVKASPTAGNPYHADIILPDSAVEDYEEQVRHAQELADDSRWKESPPITSDS